MSVSLLGCSERGLDNTERISGDEKCLLNIYIIYIIPTACQVPALCQEQQTETTEMGRGGDVIQC